MFEQNGWQVADDIFKGILLNEMIHILFQISLNFAFDGPFDNITQP